MADTERVVQAGVTVVSEADAANQRVYQSGITVVSEADAANQRVYQAGVTVVSLHSADYLRLQQAGVTVVTCAVLAAHDSNLSATRAGSAITLGWDAYAAGDDPSGYRVERSYDGTVWHKVAEVDESTLTYTDSPMLFSASYRIVVLLGACEYVCSDTASVAALGFVEPEILESRWKLRFRRANPALLAEMGYSHADGGVTGAGVEWFRYYKSVYGCGFLEFSLLGALPWLADFGENGQVEVWRQIGSEPWALEFVSLSVNDYERSWPDGVQHYHYRGPDVKDILARATVNWYAGYTDRSAFAGEAAETIGKTLVQYNVTSDATLANGRLVTFASPFTVEIDTDLGRGNALDWFCFEENLLETLGKLARVGGGDFDLVRDPDAAGDYLRYRFYYYPGQLGTDRSATVTFSLALGNLSNPVVRNAALGAPSVLTVGGPDEGAARQFTTATAANYATTRHREGFLNASDVETAAGRAARGNAELEAARVKETFEWEAIQTAGSRYGEHYGLGDLVTVIRPDTGTASTHKITGVSVSVNQNGAENIVIDTEPQ